MVSTSAAGETGLSVLRVLLVVVKRRFDYEDYGRQLLDVAKDLELVG